MALEDDIRLLSEAPIFCHLEKDALRLLAFAAENMALEERQILFSAGDMSDGGYILRQGRLSIQPKDSTSRTTVGPGALIGRTSLFTRITRTATVKAESPCSVIRISSNLMKRCLEEYPTGATVIYNVIAEDLHSLTGKMVLIKDSYLGDI